MDERKILVFCYWNGCIKYGLNGIYYEGSTRRVIRVNLDTELNRLLDRMYLITGLDKQRSKHYIIGRYPSAVGQSTVKYVGLPVKNDRRLELMLQVPIIHPCISHVELYLQGNGLTPKDLNVPCLEVPSLCSDVQEFRVGMRFKDIVELKKALDWCSIKERKFCRVGETSKDMCTFECIRWRCKWSLCAARMEEEHRGCFEITKYVGPHTCCPEDPEVVGSVFEADEIERVVRLQPTISVVELNRWWKEKTGFGLEMVALKRKAIEKIFGDWDQSFRSMPKLMAAFHSSNGLLVDWQYDIFPNPDFASFLGVFWAFPQSVEGFQHCRPLIVVDTKDLKGKYNMKLMIASGIDAANESFPLAFAVTKEVSIDSWRWFLTRIREHVTQRKGICLISSPHPDILAVINEPGSHWKEPWAYHRFCLDHLCYQFRGVFENYCLESLVKKAGYSSGKEEFDSYMNEIKERNTEALFAVCRGFLCHTVAMTGGVILLFDELRSLFDKSFSCSHGSLNCGDVYTEPVMDKLQEFMTGSATYVIKPLERDTYQVAKLSEDEEWIVQLNDSICTCGEFQAYKFPCLHALAVCDKLKINPLQYVDDCYTFERYYKTYSAKFNPVPEVSTWPEASGDPTLFPPVIAPPPPPVSGSSSTSSSSSSSTSSSTSASTSVSDSTSTSAVSS